MLQTALIVAAMSAILASVLPAAVQQTNASFAFVGTGLGPDAVCAKHPKKRNLPGLCVQRSVIEDM